MQIELFISRSVMIICLIYSSVTGALAQNGRIVLNNNPYLVIDNNAKLVINNPDANALNVDGRIISESENDAIIWNISNTIGTYIIPWGTNPTGSDVAIPLTIDITNPGSVGGQLTLSTYSTSTDFNFPYPTGVLNLDVATVDASLSVVDRFWLIKNDTYVTKPDVNLVFTYDPNPNEIGGSNIIVESDLKAQRFDDINNSWGNIAFGSSNTLAKTVSATISSSNFFSTWILESSMIPLNIVYSDISIENINCDAKIEMHDYVEDGLSYVNIYKSTDGINWNNLGRFDNCFDGTCTFYDSDYDRGLRYYRFLEISENGNVNTLETLSFNAECSSTISLFPNPTRDELTIKNCENTTFQITDCYGRLISKDQSLNMVKTLNVSHYEPGEYFIQFYRDSEPLEMKKFIKQ